MKFKALAYVDRGFLGDPEAWCWWSADHPERGPCGPYDSKSQATGAAEGAGFDVDSAELIARDLRMSEVS